MVYDECFIQVQMIGYAFICRQDINSVLDDVVMHSFTDDPACRCYGPSLLRGSRMMRIASSWDLCPKVIGIDHTSKISCVLQVMMLLTMLLINISSLDADDESID